MTLPVDDHSVDVLSSVTEFSSQSAPVSECPPYSVPPYRESLRKALTLVNRVFVINIRLRLVVLRSG